MSLNFGLIGHEIQYSKSPFIHRIITKHLNIDASYELLD
ncbi:MAG: hypothetical protein JXC31_03780, partial [Acholeplasmataceae bacterium]|nr:hypothetical protein [Acholeplasmataceae bacterium]